MDDSDKLSRGLPQVLEEEPHSRASPALDSLSIDPFLLAQQRVREYKTIALDYEIIARVKDMTFADTRTSEA